ncbi:MAG: FG-GAP-like repeat-containing protein [Candidatus Paceibacteria bacterium]
MKKIFHSVVLLTILALAFPSTTFAVSFDSPVNIASNSVRPTFAHAMGDIDNNGKMDLVMESFTTGIITVIRDIYNNPSIEPQTHLAAETGNFYGMALGDLDGDGDLDLVTAGPNGSATSPNNVYYWDNDTERYEKAGSAFAIAGVAFYGVNAHIADFTGNGKNDVLWGANTTAYLAINSTTVADDLSFSSITAVSGFPGSGSAGQNIWMKGDFNGDGLTDLVGADLRNSGGVSGTYHIAISNGNGTFAIASSTVNDGMAGRVVAVADFNQDGRDDFVLARATTSPSYVSTLTVYTRNEANDGFDMSEFATVPNKFYSKITTGDFNGDTYPDIAVYNNQGTQVVDIYLNDGEGGFSSTVEAAVFGFQSQIDAYDLDGDGLDDLIGLHTNAINYYLAIDDVAPTVVSFSPADNAANVAVDTNLTITFDELVGFDAGDITVKKVSDDSTVFSIPVAGGDFDSAVLTVALPDDLDYNTAYYVNISPTAVADTSGNNFAGISDNSTWNFTTGAEPESEVEERSSVARKQVSTVYGCKDLSATNYNFFSAHKQELCQFGTTVGENTSTLIKQLQTLLANLLARYEELTGRVYSKGVVADTTSTPEVVRDLNLGMEGSDVAALQSILIEKNTGPASVELARVGATGFFGTYTANALTEYQQQNAILPPNGYFGPTTRAQMKDGDMNSLWW